MLADKKRSVYLQISALITAFFCLLLSVAHANPLPSMVEEEFQQQLDSQSVNTAEIQLNLQIPITDNPAGPDTGLWATAIYHNDDTQRPTILLATAYRREIMTNAYLMPFVKRGYNVLAVDMRGTGSSEGVWGALDPAEQYDVAQIIDRWIPAQPWSDGRVGMVGGSYMAILQYSAAALVEKTYNPVTGKVEPVHLKAIAPFSSLSDAYSDIATHGGMFDAEFMTIWLSLTDLLSVLPPNTFATGEPVDQASVNYFLDVWQQHIDQLSIPFSWIFDPDNIRKNAWYNAKSPYIYWPVKPEQGWDLCSEFPAGLGEKVLPNGLPVFTATGWFDIFTRGSLNNFQYGLSEHGVSDKAMLIGPWYHVGAAVLNPGIDSVGLSSDLTLNFDLLVRWFDWKIKGEAAPILEDFSVLSYVLGAERWRAEKSWPLPESRVSKQRYFLSKDKAPVNNADWFAVANSKNNYKLVKEIATDDLYNQFLWFKFRKNDPVLKHRPPFFHGVSSRSAQRWFGFSPLTLLTQLSKYTFDDDLDSNLPWEDERFDEVGSLTFTSEPLQKDLEVVGPLKLTFWAKTHFGYPLAQHQVDVIIEDLQDKLSIRDGSNLLINEMDKRDVQWIVEVNDVFPDGRARNITSGWLSAWSRPYDPSDHSALDPSYKAFDPFYDQSARQPMPIDEETLYPYVVEIWPTHNVFKKGHRFRVSLSASDVPHLLPVLRPSNNTIVIDEAHPASIEFDVANKLNEGITWKWLDDVNAYLQ